MGAFTFPGVVDTSVSDERLSLEPVGRDRVAYVERLLTANDLPAEDVASKPEWFYVARRDGERVGIGGLEVYGTDGLLRSVVVEERVRGEGLGVALCERLESEAAAAGIETLYLLTTTAAEFFAGRGYEATVREDAPATIRDTTEFADLCPSRATCMRKSL
jgi:amino-acid N-acetyltransferase